MTIVVTGATGNIAAEFVARATPDGYTLLLVNSQNTINAALFPNLPFDFVRDIGREAPAPRHQWAILEARDRPADHSHLSTSITRSPSRPVTRRPRARPRAVRADSARWVRKNSTTMTATQR